MQEIEYAMNALKNNKASGNEDFAHYERCISQAIQCDLLLVLGRNI
jgi:hypothetical protein